MAEVIVSSEWSRLNSEELRGTVVVIGAPDTGKSTLAHFLFQRAASCGLVAAFLDTDVGQSTLGLPTTLNLNLAAGPGDDRFPPQGPWLSYFVGATTPRGHMLPAVVGSFRLRQKALSLGAQSIIVDTSGLIDPEQGGLALKQYKIELLAPELVIGLQRRHELESILWPLRCDRRVRTIEVPVSPHVVERPRVARIARRRELLRRYFLPAKSLLFSLRCKAVYNIERLAIGAMVALQDVEGFALGLGVVEQVNHQNGTCVLRTPLPNQDGVHSLRCGTARWDLSSQREA